MTNNGIITSFLALSLVLSLSACAAEEEKKPEIRLPRDVVSDVPVPYTGEVGKPINPVTVENDEVAAGTDEGATAADESTAGVDESAPASDESTDGSATPGLQIYQINDDGTSQEITPGVTPPSLEADPPVEASALDVESASVTE